MTSPSGIGGPGPAAAVDSFCCGRSSLAGALSIFAWCALPAHCWLGRMQDSETNEKTRACDHTPCTYRLRFGYRKCTVQCTLLLVIPCGACSVRNKKQKGRGRAVCILYWTESLPFVLCCVVPPPLPSIQSVCSAGAEMIVYNRGLLVLSSLV